MPSFHGLLVLDKPGGITSREAVDGALRWFPRGTRVGHTGTLDPLATGVLVLTLGPATRLTDYVQRMRKTYRAGVRLGARSDTDDADGTIEPVAGPIPDSATVAARLGEMIGEIDQVPPTYSAAKVSGRRAYDLARQGREVDLQPRRVRIYGIDVLVINPGLTQTNFPKNMLERKSRLQVDHMRGMTAAQVATATLKAIARGKNEVTLSGMGKLFVVASRFFPRAVDRIAARRVRKLYRAGE